MDRGYPCIELKEVIFINAEKPEKKSPEYSHWKKTFRNRLILNDED